MVRLIEASDGSDVLSVALETIDNGITRMESAAKIAKNDGDAKAAKIIMDGVSKLDSVLEDLSYALEDIGFYP